MAPRSAARASTPRAASTAVRAAAPRVRAPPRESGTAARSGRPGPARARSFHPSRANRGRSREVCSSSRGSLTASAVPAGLPAASGTHKTSSIGRRREERGETRETVTFRDGRGSMSESPHRIAGAIRTLDELGNFLPAPRDLRRQNEPADLASAEIRIFHRRLVPLDSARALFANHRAARIAQGLEVGGIRELQLKTEAHAARGVYPKGSRISFLDTRRHGIGDLDDTDGLHGVWPRIIDRIRTLGRGRSGGRNGPPGIPPARPGIL